MASWPKLVSHPDDFSWVIYRLRPEARWHDGKPVTPDDVIFSLDALKKHQPAVLGLLPPCGEGREDRRARRQVHLRRAPATANCRRSSANSRCCRSIGGKAPTAQGRKRDISATTLEKPLGSGPYRIKEFVAGRSLTLERVKDYWGAISPIERRTATISTSCASNSSATTSSRSRPSRAIRSTGMPRTAPRTGRRPMTSRPCNDKRVLLEESFRSAVPGVMQAFALRTAPARPVQGSRGCAARFNYAFDFEEMNKQLFYRPVQAHQQLFRWHPNWLGDRPAARARNWRFSKPCAARCRRRSSRRPTPIRSAAIPEAVREQSARGAAAAEGSRLSRSRERKLVDQQDGQRRSRSNCSAQTRPSSASCCSTSLRWSGSASPSASAPSMPMQYENRLRSWDFDMIIDRRGGSRCRPATSSANSGVRKRRTWPGSRNIVGIKNPAIDKLIERVIFAKDRDDLVAATKALDRVLLWNLLRRAAVELSECPRTARWDRFSRPCRTAQIRPVGLPGAVVVRRGQGGADRQALLKDIMRMAQFSRRHVLGLGVGALSAVAAWARARRRRGRRRGARHLGVRRSEISRRLQEFRLRECRSAQGRRVFDHSLDARL